MAINVGGLKAAAPAPTTGTAARVNPDTSFPDLSTATESVAAVVASSRKEQKEKDRASMFSQLSDLQKAGAEGAPPDTPQARADAAKARMTETTGQEPTQAQSAALDGLANHLTRAQSAAVQGADKSRIDRITTEFLADIAAKHPEMFDEAVSVARDTDQWLRAAYARTPEAQSEDEKAQFELVKNYATAVSAANPDYVGLSPLQIQERRLTDPWLQQYDNNMRVAFQAKQQLEHSRNMDAVKYREVVSSGAPGRHQALLTEVSKAIGSTTWQSSDEEKQLAIARLQQVEIDTSNIAHGIVAQHPAGEATFQQDFGYIHNTVDMYINALNGKEQAEAASNTSRTLQAFSQSNLYRRFPNIESQKAVASLVENLGAEFQARFWATAQKNPAAPAFISSLASGLIGGGVDVPDPTANAFTPKSVQEAADAAKQFFGVAFESWDSSNSIGRMGLVRTMGATLRSAKFQGNQEAQEKMLEGLSHPKAKEILSGPEFKEYQADLGHMLDDRMQVIRETSRGALVNLPKGGGSMDINGAGILQILLKPGVDTRTSAQVATVNADLRVLVLATSNIRNIDAREASLYLFKKGLHP